MDQISKTVNSFLASIVGVGLICFASFIFLLASAQLNNSVLGTLLAQVAGETARTARTESFAYWGRVGAEVADGLGYGQPLFPGTGGGAVITPVVVVPTTAPNTTPVPTATPRPANYIRSSPFSEGGLLLWRGLDAKGAPLEFGVSLKNVQQQVEYALNQNSGDLLALWLKAKVEACLPLYNQMVKANYNDRQQADQIRTTAAALIAQCNPRLFEAYAHQRWASLSLWTAQNPVDEAQAAELLAGLRITVKEKIDGPARQIRSQDNVSVEIQPLPEFALGGFDLVLTAGALDNLLGVGNWQLSGGPYLVGGVLFPANPAEPVLPTEADLSTPTPSTSAGAQTAPEGTAGTTSSTPGVYIVQQGDTLYSIARRFNITPQALIAANQDKVGFNPNFITIGMELRIP